MTHDWQRQYLTYVIDKTGKAPSAIAKIAGMASTTLTRPLNNPKHVFKLSNTTLDKIQSKTGIPYGPFASGLTPEGGEAWAVTVAHETDADHVSITALDVQASAGDGVIPPDYPEIADRLTFPANYLRSITRARPEDLSIIGVKGDSMLDTLQHDDVVMIDTTKTSLAYDGLFVLNLDGAVHVKRVTRASRPGWVTIVSDNRSKYPPFERAADDVRVIGKVIWKGTRE